MALCWPRLFLLLFTFSTNAIAATTFTLTTELTNFVPACAQACFISFLDNNFGDSGCASKPSLDCLCSHNTTTGYTVGEGALQCIISEQNIGFCSGVAAGESVARTAYQMCIGRKGALSNTHSTITATLLARPTQSSVVVVAPSTTRIIPSSMASVTSLTLPSITATGSSASATTTGTVGPAPTTLSKNQIVGIGAGIAGGALLSLLLILLVLCMQRRKTKKLAVARDSGDMPFQSDPEFYGMHGDANNMEKPVESVGPGGSASGMAGKRFLRKLPPLVPPVAAPMNISNPNMFSSHTIQPNTIGLAISPDQSIATEKIPHTPRRSSKLLPEKPTLKLEMPPQKKKVEPAGLTMPPMMKSAISRNSNMTQFELDEEDSADTAVNSENAWGRSSTEQILRSNKNIEAYSAGSDRPEPPTAAIAVMRPDEFHWRPTSLTSPASNTASPIVLSQPSNMVARNIGSFSQPRRVAGDIRPAQEMPQSLQIKIPEQARAVSSVYTARGSLPASEAPRHSVGRARKSYGQPGPYDTGSAASVTTFGDLNSAISPEGDTRYAELSPVVESPRDRMVVESPASGKSPVSYPKIPKRLSTAQMAQPPPSQPNFTVSSPESVKPWRQAELVAQRFREAHAYDVPQETPSNIQIAMLSPGRGLGHQRKSSREDTQPTRTYNFPAPPPQQLSQNQLPPTPKSLARNGSVRLQQPPPSGPLSERRPISPPPRFPMTPPLPLQVNQSRFPQMSLPPTPQSERRGITPPPRFPMTPPSPAPSQKASNSPPQLQRFQTPPPGPLSARLPIEREPPLQRPNIPSRITELSEGSSSCTSNSTSESSCKTVSETNNSSSNSLIPLQLQPQPRTTSPPQPHSQFNSHIPRSSTTSPRPTHPLQNPLASHPHPAITFTRSSSLASQSSTFTASSGASSLLAKRLGGEKASALKLAQQQSEEDKKRQASKWRTLDQRGIAEAKKEDWKPRLGSPGLLLGDPRGDNGEVRETVREFRFERTELPRTPGWVPKLTPTRRGDDLFLSVA